MSDVPPSSTLYLDGKHALAIGDPMYLRDGNEEAFSCIIGGFVFFGKLDERSSIFALTGGGGKRWVDMCTTYGDRVGVIAFNWHGLNFIELEGGYREYVCNLIRSTEGQVCIPFIYEGSGNDLRDKPVLCHTGNDGPKTLQINATAKKGDIYNLLINIENVGVLPLGTLVTDTQGRKENARQLPAYGPVCCHVEFRGQTTASVTLLKDVIAALQREEKRFEKKEASFVTPIRQPETKEERSGRVEEAAGVGDVDVDGADDTDTSGLASVGSVASIASAEQVAGAMAQGKGDIFPDQKESGYGSR